MMLTLLHGGLVAVTDPCYLKPEYIDLEALRHLEAQALEHGYAVAEQGLLVLARMDTSPLQVDTSNLLDRGGCTEGNVCISATHSLPYSIAMCLASSLGSDSGLMCVIDAAWIPAWLANSEQMYDELLAVMDATECSEVAMTERMVVFSTGEPTMSLYANTSAGATALRLDVGDTDLREDEDGQDEDDYDEDYDQTEDD